MGPPQTTGLKLHFLSRARLWSEVVVSAGERVFVPTTEAFAVGAKVTVEIDAPEFDAPLFISAAVQQLRPLGVGQPAGVLVKVDESSLEKLRALVANHDDAARAARVRPATMLSWNTPRRSFALWPRRASAPV